MKTTQRDILQKENLVLHTTIEKYQVELEQKNRLLELEAALEVVRSRSMAMQKSEELMGVGELIYKELSKLGIENMTAGYVLVNDTQTIGWNYGVNPKDGTISSDPTGIPLKDSPVMRAIIKSWKRQEPVVVLELDAEKTIAHQTFIAENATNFPLSKEELLKISPERLVIHTFNFSHGYLLIVGGNVLRLEEKMMVSRFAKVFEQTYVRFLDLKKAEAQARESQSQLALERVRARTMAMQHSDELQEASQMLDEQVRSLGIETWGCAFHIYNKDDSDSLVWDEEWFSSQSGILTPYKTPRENIFKKYYNISKTGKDLYIQKIGPDEIQDHYKYLQSLPVIGTALKNAFGSGVPIPQQQFDHIAYFKQGHLLFITYKPVPEAHDIFKRFAKVFEQAYTRFLDLKNAEERSRELQIENSLEKVRAESMAMKKPEDLLEVCEALVKELQSLGFTEIRNAMINIYKENDYRNYDYSLQFGSDMTRIPYTFYPPIDRMIQKTKTANNAFFDFSFRGSELEDFRKKRKENGEPDDPKLDQTKQLHYYFYAFENGSIGISTYEPISEEKLKLLKRFRNVFDLSYKRYNDIARAEAQARESEIQLALERVRARTMAMHKSEELAEVSTVLFQQLNVLGNTPERINIGIVKEEKGIIEYWATDQGGNQIDHSFKTSIEEPTTIAKVYAGWKKHMRSMVVDLKGEELNAWLQYLLNELKMPFKEELVHKRRVHTVAYFSQGMLLISTPEPVNKETIGLLERFASVFDHTYRRFLDLKIAEAQARESQIEAALEKVRSRTLAMQKSDELSETSVVVFKQLIELGIEPNRLFIGIIKGSHEIETWATNEDGTKIASRFDLDTRKNASIKEMYQGWKQQKQSLVIDMKGQVLKDYFHYLAEEKHIPFKGGLSQKRRIQYIAFFSKGFIGMASPKEQPKETLELLERFAAVFNLTFTRFNDLKIAEANALKAEQDLIEIKAAREKAETALAELQATQQQLIHSEKMASLGQLTAGIAHEIKNPLNFVNNFSEVTKELLEEMNEELKNGNYELVAEIAEDVNQNLEKILHHGKRADGIVKGMLQHSRSNSGQKEEITINSFVDEYLRLAYHGLRAKDKIFNVKIDTVFDPKVGEILAIPQELGRVILNLVTNAFYAVSEKKKKEEGKYEPTVWISTHKRNEFIEIKVRDNGTGIPKELKDKIFQPFFTTKPTGEGTGLGLSISYDIVKAHGGDIKVETEEGKGTSFVLFIPAQKIRDKK